VKEAFEMLGTDSAGSNEEAGVKWILLDKPNTPRLEYVSRLETMMVDVF
jgi:hypothetical protein